MLGGYELPLSTGLIFLSAGLLLAAFTYLMAWIFAPKRLSPPHGLRASTGRRRIHLVARTIPDFHYVAALSFSILIPVAALILLGLSSVSSAPTVENRELLVMGVLYILVAISLILIYLLKRGFLSWK